MATIPPYDKDQWKAQRQAQKEQWKAQRDAQRAYWRAQRDATRSQRYAYSGRSIVGPLLLLSAGAIFLLVELGKIDGHHFWALYGHWWPLVLILIGVVSLAEWAIDRGNPYPRRSGGWGFVIVLLVIVGISASASNHVDWGGLESSMGDYHKDFNYFNGPEHDFDATLTHDITVGAPVTVETHGHGDVTVTTSVDTQMHLALHKRVWESNERSAEKEADAIVPNIAWDGNAMHVTIPGRAHSQVNVELSIPATSSLGLKMENGDATVNGRQAAVNVQSQRGDLHFDNVTGTIIAHSSNGDAMINGVRGDVQLTGKYDDVALSDVSGITTLDGEFMGDLKFSNLAGGIHFHSTRTDLQVAKLPGEVSFDSDDLRASGVIGPFQLKTRAKNLDLSQVSGDISINNADGEVSVTPGGPLGNVNIDTTNGVTVTLPGDAGFRLSASTNDGDINNDFGVPVTGDDHKTSQGTVGSGALQVRVSTHDGDIHIKKGGTVEVVRATPPHETITAAPLESKPRKGTVKAADKGAAKTVNPPASSSSAAAGIVQQ